MTPLTDREILGRIGLPESAAGQKAILSWARSEASGSLVSAKAVISDSGQIFLSAVFKPGSACLEPIAEIRLEKRDDGWIQAPPRKAFPDFAPDPKALDLFFEAIKALGDPTVELFGPLPDRGRKA